VKAWKGVSGKAGMRWEAWRALCEACGCVRDAGRGHGKAWRMRGERGGEGKGGMKHRGCGGRKEH